MDNSKIMVIAEMDIMKDDLIYGSTDFVFYQRAANGMNYIFDEYFNSADWEDGMHEKGYTESQNIFSFRSVENPDHIRMLIVERVEMDSEEMDTFSDIIEFSD